MDISVKEINSITFGIYSPEEIIKQSVVRIDSNKLHGENSVYDERMGILENNKLCEIKSIDVYTNAVGLKLFKVVLFVTPPLPRYLIVD
jgi:hypothetical protein